MTEQTPTSIVKNEPVLLAHALSSVVAFIGTSVGLDQASSSRLVNLVVPGAVSLALMLQGVVIRRWVAPAWKVAESFVKKETGVDLTGPAEALAALAELGLNPDGAPANVPTGPSPQQQPA